MVEKYSENDCWNSFIFNEMTIDQKLLSDPLISNDKTFSPSIFFAFKLSWFHAYGIFVKVSVQANALQKKTA